MKCQLANLTIRNTTLLERWKNGTSIIREKKQNDISVSKLRAILLLENDFNVVNKIIFKTRLILILKAKDLIPKEIIREKHR